MKTTFLNGDKELYKRGKKYLQSRVKDFKGFIKHGTDIENIDSSELTKSAQKFFDEIGSFYDYGLSIDYVAPETFEDTNEGYLRYQLSWGGPSDEIRFYFTPGFHVAYRIEYVFLDWGTGVGFDVTNEDWAQWLFDWFDEIGTAQAEYDKAINEL